MQHHARTSLLLGLAPGLCACGLWAAQASLDETGMQVPVWNAGTKGKAESLAATSGKEDGEVKRDSASDALRALDPQGKTHIVTGVANTLDTLKTFVEAEGNFSPGFATYGVYFWVYDVKAVSLKTPASAGVNLERGLAGVGYLIPWSFWQAGMVGVRTEVCEVRHRSTEAEVFVCGARAILTNAGAGTANISLLAVLRPLGAAGGPVRRLAVSEDGMALMADGHPALVAEERPFESGVSPADNVARSALSGKAPEGKTAESATGDCSGAMRFDVALEPGKTKTFGFVCPVLPGRRAAGHDWDRTSGGAQLDLAEPNPKEGGLLQADPGLKYYRTLKTEVLFREATAYWRDLVGRSALNLPDARWAECFAATIGHAAMAMNEGAADAAAVNCNVLNRGGASVANALQKAGHPELAGQAVDYFLSRPFNGRVQCEADNPGQVLLIMGEQWLFTKDKTWLTRVYPSAAKLAAMIRYCRTTEPPHYVKAASLDFGDALPPDRSGGKPADRRQELKAGSCDGYHPEYTDAFDVAGLRAAALLAKAAGKEREAADWRKTADLLSASYDERFGGRLADARGSCAVLWPCRLYPLDSGKAFEQFREVGRCDPRGLRYFPLAAAHQGLLAGNRAAGYATVNAHLDHEQMRGWYALDEGGRSWAGGWRFARSRWNPGVAMPHGWAAAEMFLLLRDCLAFESGQKLVLLGGIPDDWFAAKSGWSFGNLSTHFGRCSLAYEPRPGGANVKLSGGAAPPEGFVLRLPRNRKAEVNVDGKRVEQASTGDVPLPHPTSAVDIRWGE